MTRETSEAALDRFAVPRTRVAQADRDGVTPEVAVAWLFQRHHAPLVRVAYAMLGTREAAEDAVQDAFVALFRQWGRLRDPMSAEAYLRSAVLNRCRSGIRQRVQERTFTATAVVPPYVATPDEDAQRHQDAVLVGQALRLLPRRQSEVVACRYLLELSVAETAETLGISDGAVKRHAYRGLRALHTALEVTR